MVQQASQVFYVKDPTLEHWYVVLHGKKQGEAIDDIENGDPRSFTPMIINKDDDVHATLTVKEFTYEQSTYMQPINKHLEFYVLFLYDFNSMQIN